MHTDENRLPWRLMSAFIVCAAALALACIVVTVAAWHLRSRPLIDPFVIHQDLSTPPSQASPSQLRKSLSGDYIICQDSGEVNVNGHMMPQDELATFLESLVRDQPVSKMRIIASPSCPQDHIRRVQKICRQFAIEQVQLEVVPSGAGSNTEPVYERGAAERDSI